MRTTTGIKRTTYYQKGEYGAGLEHEVTKQPGKDERFIEIIAYETDIRRELNEIWEKLDKIAKIL